VPRLILEKTYGFEDVSLMPNPYSEIHSRKTDIDTGCYLGEVRLGTPIIASPMADVCDDKLAIAMHKAGAIGCIHRFQPIDEQAEMVNRVSKAGAECLAAVGTTPDALHRAGRCIENGAMGIIVDVAFLNRRTLEACSTIRKEFPDIYLISGNIATPDSLKYAVEAGLNAVRIGIGNGQACRTSRVTGVGIGLLTSIIECYNARKAEELDIKFICDGGIDVGGSFAKAIAAGADYAIMGRAFAATNEAPGKTYAATTDFTGGELGSYAGMALCNAEQTAELFERGCPIYKEYRGSASMEAQMVYKARQDIITSEGVASLVKVFGPVEEVLGRLNGALRSSMSYLGASNYEEFRNNAYFYLVSDGMFNQTKARTLQSREITI